MKKTIALAACLATFAMHCQETYAIKKIEIKRTTKQEDGTDLVTEQVIRAIKITPEQAQELQAMHETQSVPALEGSRIYNQVFTIGETAYFIMMQNNQVSLVVKTTDEIAEEPVANN